MIFRRYGQFTGGIDLPDDKDATLNSAIAPCAPLSRLRVPLDPCRLGRSAKPIVSCGDRVAAGAKIAAGEASGSLDIYAPLAGRVVGACQAELPGPDGFEPAEAIELDELCDPANLDTRLENFEWRGANPALLRRRIAEGSLTTHGAPVRPLADWLQQALDSRCRCLVANLMENQPCLTADHRLLVEYGADIIRGLAILSRAMEATDVILAADHRRTEDYGQLVAPARMHRITRIALPHKYPGGSDAMLVKVLRRREVPEGGSSMDVGTAVTDAATCLAVYRWTACNLPQTHRVTTVAGEIAALKGNFWTPFGAGCLELAAAQGAVVHGGPMSGVACTSRSVCGPSTGGLLAMAAPRQPSSSPCIRCGWCTDHCPTRLNVSALNDAFELSLPHRARRLGALSCLECGVCSYVCPAQLPLAARVRQLKRVIQARQAAALERS